jgi:hypothetical protein
MSLIFSVRPNNVGWSPPSNLAKIELDGGRSTGTWELIDGQLSLGASSGSWMASLSTDQDYSGYLDLVFFDTSCAPPDVVMRLQRVDPDFLNKFSQIPFYGPGRWGYQAPPRSVFSTDGLTWVSAPGVPPPVIQFDPDTITADGSDDGDD